MKNGLKDYPFVLGAGAEVDLNVQGDYFQVISASGDIGLRFDEAAMITRAQGMGGSAEYSRVSVYSPIAQTVVVSLGYGIATDSRASLSATVNTTVEPATQNIPLAEVSVGAGSTVLLAAANADQKELRVGVKSTEANGVYIGDVTVGAAIQGGYIEEGCVDYVATEAALYGYNPGAAAISVNVLSLRKP